MACLLLGILCSATGQPDAPEKERFTISGYLKDATSGEELLYASVYEPTTKAGTTTNLYGFYSLTLPAGTYELTFTYVGYQAMVKTVTLRANVELNAEMQPGAAVLEEVVVTDKKPNHAVQQVAMSRIDVPIEEIKKLPSLLGEPDIIKTIQMLPG